MTHLFISYSHANRKDVEELELQLQELNFEVWRDQQIPIGDRWETTILKKIKECSVFLIVMTDNSANSPSVKKEIEQAIALKKPIIPILRQGKTFLSELQYEDMTSDIRVTPRLQARIKRAIQEVTNEQNQIRSLEYYVDELEQELSRIVNLPIVSSILQFERQKKLLAISLSEQLKPSLAPLDIHMWLEDKDAFEEIFTVWEETVEELCNYAQNVGNITEDLRQDIEDYVAAWESHLEDDPDAIELPPYLPPNDPSMYDNDLFGN